MGSSGSTMVSISRTRKLRDTARGCLSCLAASKLRPNAGGSRPFHNRAPTWPRRTDPNDRLLTNPAHGPGRLRVLHSRRRAGALPGGPPQPTPSSQAELDGARSRPREALVRSPQSRAIQCGPRRRPKRLILNKLSGFCVMVAGFCVRGILLKRLHKSHPSLMDRAPVVTT